MPFLIYVSAALDSLRVGCQVHIMALEAADPESQQALLAGMEYLLSISFVDDDEARSPTPQFSCSICCYARQMPRSSMPSPHAVLGAA